MWTDEQWRQFFAQEDITDPEAQERMKSRYSTGYEYLEESGISGRRGDQVVGGDRDNPFGGGGDDGMLSPADWQSDYIEGGLDYLKENRGMLMDRMGPHYESLEHLARTGQNVATEDMITADTQEQVRLAEEQFAGAGLHKADFLQGLTQSIEAGGRGATAQSRSNYSQWASEQQGSLDATLAGFLANTAGSYAGLSGAGAGIRNPALEKFGMMMGGTPWKSERTTMSGGRNPTPSDFYQWSQSRPSMGGGQGPMQGTPAPQPKGRMY